MYALSPTALHVSSERQHVAQMRHALPIIYPSIYPRKTKDRPSLSLSLSLLLPLAYDVRSFSTRCRRQTARRPAKISIRGGAPSHPRMEINRRPNRPNEHLSHIPRDPIRRVQ